MPVVVVNGLALVAIISICVVVDSCTPSIVITMIDIHRKVEELVLLLIQ